MLDTRKDALHSMVYYYSVVFMIFILSYSLTCSLAVHFPVAPSNSTGRAIAHMQRFLCIQGASSTATVTVIFNILCPIV